MQMPNPESRKKLTPRHGGAENLGTSLDCILRAPVPLCEIHCARRRLSPESCLLTPGSRRGGALAMTLAALLAVSLVAAALVQSMLAAHRQAQRYAAQTQAVWLAEAGLSRAAAQLARQSDYAGETWPAPVGSREDDVGEVTIRIEPKTDEATRRVVVEAVYPPHEHHRILIRREQPLP